MPLRGLKQHNLTWPHWNQLSSRATGVIRSGQPTKEDVHIPVAFVQEFPISGDDRSTANYDAISKHVESSVGVPDGLISHSAGFDEEAGVFRIFDVWENQAQAQRFLDETIMPFFAPLMSSGDAPPPPAREGFYDLHNVVTQ